MFFLSPQITGGTCVSPYPSRERDRDREKANEGKITTGFENRNRVRGYHIAFPNGALSAAQTEIKSISSRFRQHISSEINPLLLLLLYSLLWGDIPSMIFKNAYNHAFRFYSIDFY